MYVELPEVDVELAKGDSVGAIESVKAASDIYSPISGKVTEKNSDVEETPALINKSTYEKGKISFSYVSIRRRVSYFMFWNSVTTQKMHSLNLLLIFSGWLFKLNVSKEDELNDLMNEEAYESFKQEEQQHN